MTALTAAATTRRRRLKRVVRLSAILAPIGFVAASIAAALVYQYGQQFVGTTPPSVDAIIVLGAGANWDGSPTTSQIRRVTHGVALYKQGVAPRLLCTGRRAPGHLKSEAQTCVELAQTQGVPADAILREDASANTQENIIQSQRVMAANGLHTAVIVSDLYHLFRAQWLCGWYGLAASYSAAETTQGPLPVGEAVLYSYREVGALIVDNVRLRLGS
ncbi:MAG: YdcF family protein [Aggregatilineales bacterium]